MTDTAPNATADQLEKLKDIQTLRNAFLAIINTELKSDTHPSIVEAALVDTLALVLATYKQPPTHSVMLLSGLVTEYTKQVDGETEDEA